MANLKSSKKDIARIARNTAINRAARSKVRTFLKKAILAISSNNADMQKAIVEFESVAMKAVRKGIFSKKAVSRKVSRLIGRMNSLQKVS